MKGALCRWGAVYESLHSPLKLIYIKWLFCFVFLIIIVECVFQFIYFVVFFCLSVCIWHNVKNAQGVAALRKWSCKSKLCMCNILWQPHRAMSNAKRRQLMTSRQTAATANWFEEMNMTCNNNNLNNNNKQQ